MEGSVVWDHMDYPLKNHLKEGSLADLRDAHGFAARVVGEVGLTRPRTVEAWANLTVTPYYLPSATSSYNLFELAIEGHKAVFITRSDQVHEVLPTAVHYRITPLGMATNPTAPSLALVKSDGWLSPMFWGCPARAVSSCVWLYNLAYSAVMPSGYYLRQGSLLKLAWRYPVLIAPLGMGCLALAMAFDEVAVEDALWWVIRTVLNATWRVGGLVADRFGEPAGRAVKATVAIYAAFFMIALGALFVGWSVSAH